MKLKPEELRLGNVVFIDYNGVDDAPEYRVDALLILNMVKNPFFVNVKGIELTEEWLSKFGFDQTGKYFTNNFMLSKSQNGWKLYLDFSRPAPELKTEIKFVHQLQNLFFALTGSELTIKETAQ